MKKTNYNTYNAKRFELLIIIIIIFHLNRNIKLWYYKNIKLSYKY